MARPRASGSVSLRALIWTGSVLFVLFVLLVLPFLLVRDRGVRSWLLDESLHRAVFAPEWSMKIDSVQRFTPVGLEMRGIHIVHRGPEGERPWASLGTLRVRWDLRYLLSRRLWAESIVLDSLVVHTEVPPPRFRTVVKGERKEGAAPQLPWIRLRSFELTRITIAAAAGPLATGSLAMQRLEHHARAIHAEVADANFLYVPDSLSIHVNGGRIEGVLLDRFTLQGMMISAPGLASRLDGEAVFHPEGGGPPSFATVWEVERLHPIEIPMVRRVPIPFAPGDTLSGTVRGEFRPPVLTAQLSLRGRILDGPLDRLDLQASRDGDTLKVGHLVIEHRAGRVDGWGQVLLGASSMEGRVGVAGVDVGDPSLAYWLPGAPHTRIDGAVRGNASLAKGNESGEASGEIDSLEIRGASMGPLRFAGRFADGIISIDSLALGGRGSGARVKGSWETRTGEIAGSADLDSLSLERYVAPFVAPPIGGRLSGRLTVGGRIREPRINGWLDGHDFRIVEITARHIRGDSLGGLLVPIGIGGTVHAEGIDLFGARVDSAAFGVEWDKLLHVHARASVDSIVATASVSITPTDPGSLLVESLQIQPGVLPPWDAAGDARVLWNKGTARIDDVHLTSPDGSIRARLDVGKHGDPLAGEVHIQGFDLRIPRDLLGLPDSSLVGLLDLEASIGGTAKAPSGRGTITGHGLTIARWPVGELRAEVGLEGSGAIRIDSLAAGGGAGKGRLSAHGIEINSPVPLPDFLKQLRDPATLLLRRTGLKGSLAVDDLSISRIARTSLEAVPGGGRSLFVEPADPMSGRIRTVRPGQENVPTSVASAVGGEIRLNAEISGSAAAPRGQVTGRVHNLRLYQAKADSVVFAARYVPQTLTLDSLVWHSGTQVDRARGEMSVIFSLAPGVSRVPLDRPLKLDAELPDIDLAVLGLISSDIQEPTGTLSGSIALRGTAKRVWPEGSLTIRDGGIRIPKREEKLRAVEGDLTLDSTGVRIHSLKGRIGKDGRVDLTGWWKDLGHFGLEAKVAQATFFETGLYHVTADGDLSAFPVSSPEGSYPLIVGTVDVREGAIIGDLAKQPLPPAGAVTRRSPWRAEVDVNAPGNLRMSTAFASVELGEGEDIHVSFQDPLINVSGKVQVLGGRYRVFNNVFTITSGTVEFRDTGRLPEPILDVYAETQVIDRSTAEEAVQDVLVRIHVTGPIAALSIDFSSEPERAQAEIVELLSLGRLSDPTTGTFGAKDPSRQYLFTEVVSQIESQLTNRIAGLESFQLVPGATPGEAWKLSVRRALIPQVSVAYSRELTGSADQEVNVRYNLRGRLYLNADMERFMASGTPTDRYSLDLRLRFEY
jgi:hypothetical protein